MKRILFLIFVILFGIYNVDALTMNDDSVYTSSGVVISEEQYESLSNKYSDYVIDNLSQNIINVLTSPNVTTRSESKYVVTTYVYDSDENILSENQIETTKENALAVAENENLYVNSSGEIELIDNCPVTASNYTETYYSTESKEVGIDYYEDDSGYTIKVYANWFKLPKIRVWDITAARWSNSISDATYLGFQYSDAGSSNYNIEETPNYFKSTNYGLGVSMNLYNNASSYLNIELYVYSSNSFGNTVIGTYQHARHSNAIFNISKSYTFGDGLGGVLVFSNSTYASYYDGMLGVKAV